MKNLKHGLAVCFLLMTSHATGAIFTVDYVLEGVQVSAVLSGNLQDDNDTFLVTQALQITQGNQVYDVSDYYVGLFTTINDDLPEVPIDPGFNNIGTISLSGNFIDLVVCDRLICAEGLVLVNGTGQSLFLTSFIDGVVVSEFEFDQIDWVANVNVPLPAAGWLFLTAFLGLIKFSKRSRVSQP